jgi:hypothetical protein
MRTSDLEGMSLDEAIEMLVVLGGTLAEAAEDGRYGAGATRAVDGKIVYIIAVVDDKHAACLEKLENVIHEMRTKRGTH